MYGKIRDIIDNLVLAREKLAALLEAADLNETEEAKKLEWLRYEAQDLRALITVAHHKAAAIGSELFGL